MILAGIDIGTLTCRLLIAEALRGPGPAAGRLAHLRPLQSDRRVLRLGEGVDRSRRLQPAAMARVIEALRAWQAVLASYRLDGLAVVATSAVREAVNREDFLALVRRETGLAVEVISGEEEARRTLLGIRSGLPSNVSTILGLDIGGGSTEFILDVPGRSPVVQSVEIGVVRLTERLLGEDPPAAGALLAAQEVIRQAAEAARRHVGDLAGATFVGTAGTVTTLAAMAQNLPAYAPSLVHNYRLELAAVRAIEAQLIRRSHAQRRGLPGLEAGREDVIVAGTLILRVTMETLGFQTCLVSDLGLREGVVLDLAARLRSEG